jgi:hypothetical protein
MDFSKILDYYNLISQYVFAAALIATFLVRLTPSKHDNMVLSKLIKILLYLPILGLSPLTRKMQKELEKYHGNSLSKTDSDK